MSITEVDYTRCRKNCIRVFIINIYFKLSMATKNIIVYSTQSCHYCVLTKEYLDKMGVSYVDRNVGIDRQAGQEMVMKSGQMGVPVIDIDGTIVVGFQPDLFRKLLNHREDYEKEK